MYIYKAQLPGRAWHLLLSKAVLAFLCRSNQPRVWARAGGSYSYCGNITVRESCCIGGRNVFLWGPSSFPFPAGPWEVYPPPSFHLSVSPSLTLFPRNYSVHISYGWTLHTWKHFHACELVSTHFKNILVRISLSATRCCHLSSPFCAWRRVGLCAASNASSGNERLQLDTHTKT